MKNKLDLWNDFCKQHDILRNGVPLFRVVGNKVSTIRYGKNQQVLQRSEQMTVLVEQELEKILIDYRQHTEQYDGLIYMMYWVIEEQIVPLYIGKAEKYGKSGKNLSANMTREKGKFCRWGYNYQYHLGDLSRVICPGHPPKKSPKKEDKYQRWADKLFYLEPHLQTNPVLKQPTYFWTKAWSPRDVGVWKEFGETSLTFLEYLLIGLASSIYPEDILNQEGVNRK